MKPRGLVRFHGIKRRRAPISIQPITPPTMAATNIVDTTRINSSEPNQRIWTGRWRYWGRRSSNALLLRFKTAWPSQVVGSRALRGGLGLEAWGTLPCAQANRSDHHPEGLEDGVRLDQ